MESLFLTRAKEALEHLDAETIVTAYDDPFVLDDVPSGETITDRKSLLAYFQVLFGLPNVAFTDVKGYEAEGFAVLEWTWSGTKRSSGEAFRVRGASVIEVRNGKIARETIYYDPRVPLSS
ncbi:MAG TPA: nuclear transport factor 2 family protein [Anaerolineales bacterium]